MTTNLSGGGTAHGFQQQQQQQPGSGEAVGGGQLQAALGTKWAHCVNVRLVLERAAADRRCIRVVKSPCSANIAVEFRVTGVGVEEVADSTMPEVLAGQDVMSMAIANEMDYQME